ncbi:MAG: hypothetical protein RR198_03385 [Oscillospiraceae bacterium]
MQPIYSISYTLSKESYIEFSYKENIASLMKNKANIKSLSFFQMLIAVAFMMLLYVKNSITPITIFFAVLLICSAFFSLYRLKSFDEKIIPTIEKSYHTNQYDKYKFKVDFFEDEFVYDFNGHRGSMEYYTFEKLGRGDNYLSLTFTGGKTIIFDKTCDYEKILEIVRKNLGINAQ